MKRTLLIATQNEGKIKEILSYLEHTPFDIISLLDIDPISTPEEPETTIEGNAVFKAKYYAEKTGYIALADDGGVFIDELQGWPCVKSARVAETDEERRRIVLKKMNEIKNRRAEFRTALACYDPKTKNCIISTGVREGEILEREQQGEHMWGYNPIFFLPDKQKTYAELSIQEKNETSHRGKALIQMKYLLQNQYKAKDLVVPYALVIKDTKVLMILRNDPHRPEYHKKWEFPGGSMEFGETLEENVIRETKEETGYTVEIIDKISYIAIEAQEYETFSYQIYLIGLVCKIVNGEKTLNDMETLEIKWFDLDDVLNHELVGENARMYEKLLPELKKIIQSEK